MSFNRLLRLIDKFEKLANKSDDEILEEISGPATAKEPWLESQMINAEQGHNLMDQGVEGDLPPNFEKSLQFHKDRSDRFPEEYTPGNWPYGHIIRQLQRLADKDPYMWGEIGSAYRGWTPAHISKLLKLINEYNYNE